MTPARLRLLHRTSASLVGLFVFFHLLNHLALAAGSDVHLLVMSALRSLYRAPLFEVILLALVAAQVVSGLMLARPRLDGMVKRRDWQTMSGLVVSGFLFIHVSAILWGRLYQGLDTNLWFAAAGFHVWPWLLFFVPYYGLAIIAFAAHAGFALKRLTGLDAPLPAALIGALAASAIIVLMSGLVVEVPVPDAYLASYR
jgi:hypothetical protein